MLLDPYTGKVLGEGSARARAFFRSVTDWHRWVAAEGASRPTGRPGTGGSHPLACTQGDFTKMPERVFDEWPDVKALTACRDRLAKDTDLKQYGTAAAVEDLESVRQALGYATVSVLATSYGTRVALEYVRQHGPAVRAVALSGIVPPGTKSGLTSAQDSDRALQKLFELCAADAGCSGAFPKLAADFDAGLAALDKGPASASVPLDDKQPPIKVTMSRTVFARELFQLLHSREDWLALPLAINLAAGGNFMPFAWLALQREVARNPHADGMALSVLCAQDIGSFTPAAIAATRATFMRSDRVDFLKRACGVWPHAVPDAAAAAAVRSSVPALLISGTLDPVTPPANGVEVLKTLSNGVHVVVASAAHVPANPCVNGLIASFLKAGSAKGLDTGCAANLPPLKFVTAMPSNP